MPQWHDLVMQQTHGLQLPFPWVLVCGRRCLFSFRFYGCNWIYLKRLYCHSMPNPSLCLFLFCLIWEPLSWGSSAKKRRSRRQSGTTLWWAMSRATNVVECSQNQWRGDVCFQRRYFKRLRRTQARRPTKDWRPLRRRRWRTRRRRLLPALWIKLYRCDLGLFHNLCCLLHR